MDESTCILEDAIGDSNVGVICEDLADLSSINLNREVEEEELTVRYGAADATQNSDTSDCDIQIFRPDDSEIVARYAPIPFKREPGLDDEIILNHPDDDDVVKRYASYFHSQSSKELDSVETFEAMTSVTNDESLWNATMATSAGSMLPSPDHYEPTPADDEDMSDLDPPVLENEAERGSNTANDSFTDMSDLERAHPVSPSRLSIEDESLDGFGDGAMSDPECSSHNRSITFYNLCCNKEIFSSISIDSPMREALRGLNHRRSVMRNTNPDTFETNGDCGRYTRKTRNRSRSKVSRNDNLVSVIYKLERIAQTMETRCIEARRSLRKNCSQGNSTKTGSKLTTDLTPLINTSHSLLRKIRTNVP